MSVPIQTLKASFNGGEQTPIMDARVDAAAYASGCRILENFIPRPHGMICKRPGTEYLGGTKGNVKARLFGFRRSTETNYILEFNNQCIRFWKGGTTASAVTVSGAAAWVTATAYEVGDYVTESSTIYYCTTAHTSGVFATDLTANKWVAQTAYEIPAPYALADVFDLKFCQLNDVLFIAHPNYRPQRLSRFSETNWVLEDVPFDYAPALDPNEERIALQVQYDNVPDWSNATTGYVVGDRVLGITNEWVGVLFTCHTAHNASTTANDEPGEGSNYTAYWNIGTSSETIASWANATAYVVGNKVRRNKTIYECYRNHTSSSPVTGVLNQKVGGNRPQDGQYWTRFWRISSADTDLSGLTFALVASSDVFASTDVGTIWQLEIGASGYAASINIASGSDIDPTEPLFIQGSYTASTNWNAADAMVGALYIEESLDNVTWAKVKEWVITDNNEGNVTFTGESPSVGAWYRIGVRNRTAGATGAKFKLEPALSVLTLPFEITAYTDAKTVNGYFKLPNDQLPPESIIGVSTTVWRKPAFSATNGYPAAVAFHDSRLWWAGTAGYPARIWGSHTDDFYTYLLGTLDTDGIDVTIAAVESNAIQWLASFNRTMVIGTTGDEWTLDSGESDGPLTPTSVRIRRRTRYGSSGLAPQLTGDSLLWVQRNNRRVREFAYRFETDAYAAPDMTQLAEHIAQGGFVQTAFQSAVEPILWAVCENGALAGFSYDREQNVTAWHRHITGDRGAFLQFNDDNDPTYYAADKFRSVAVIYGDTTDEVWFVVRRNNGAGGVNHYIERFNPRLMSFVMGGPYTELLDRDRWVFLDSHKFSASASGGTTGNYEFSGYEHLQGRTGLNWVNATATGTNTPSRADSTQVIVTDSTSPPAGVASGNITVNANIVIGIPVFAIVVPNRMEALLQTGTSQGREWRIGRSVFKIWRSFGGGFLDVAPLVTAAAENAPSILDYQASFNEIEYDFTRGLRISTSVDFPRENYFAGDLYTGETGEQYWEANVCQNPLPCIGSIECWPFNLLAVVFKVEVSGE